MPTSGTNTSDRKMLSQESTLCENLIVENFWNLHHIIQTSPEEGSLPEDIYLFFTSKRDRITGNAFDELCQQAEKTINDYFGTISSLNKLVSKIVICRIKPEELHLVSMSKIYPWSLIENIKHMPTLVRLDGMRILYKEDICDFMKLHLLFTETMEGKRYLLDRTRAVVQSRPKAVVINIKLGDCAIHGNVKEKEVEEEWISDSDNDVGEEINKLDPTKYSYEPLGKVLCLRKRKFQVERRIVEEPVVEMPAEPLPPKKEKKKKGKKGKGKKGKKGKGKKGKGKKGKK